MPDAPGVSTHDSALTSVFSRLQNQWNQLKRSPPGTRFRNRYNRNHCPGHNHQRPWRRVAVIAMSAVLTVIGIVLVFIPGPAIVFFFLAGALLAEQSCAIARAMDWLELRLRSLARRLIAWWRGLSFAGKSLALLAAASAFRSEAAHPLF